MAIHLALSVFCEKCGSTEVDVQIRKKDKITLAIPNIPEHNYCTAILSCDCKSCGFLREKEITLPDTFKVD